MNRREWVEKIDRSIAEREKEMRDLMKIFDTDIKNLNLIKKRLLEEEKEVENFVNEVNNIVSQYKDDKEKIDLYSINDQIDKLKKKYNMSNNRLEQNAREEFASNNTNTNSYNNFERNTFNNRPQFDNNKTFGSLFGEESSNIEEKSNFFYGRTNNQNDRINTNKNPYNINTFEDNNFNQTNNFDSMEEMNRGQESLNNVKMTSNKKNKGFANKLKSFFIEEQ